MIRLERMATEAKCGSARSRSMESGLRAIAYLWKEHAHGWNGVPPLRDLEE